MVGDHPPRPEVVLTRANHELQLVAWPHRLEDAQVVSVGLAGGRGLEIHNLVNARGNEPHVDGTRGLEQHREVRVQKLLHEGVDARLEKRLASGDLYLGRAQGLYPADYFVHLHPLPTAKGELAVTVGAAQVA